MKLYPVIFLILIWSCRPTLEVSSFNIYHGEKPFDKGKSNIEEVVDVLKKHKSKVVFLQEVDSMTARSSLLNNGVKANLSSLIGDALGYNSSFHKAIPYGGGAYGLGLLNKNKIKPITFVLPQPTAGEPRIVLGNIEKLGGKDVLLLGTHLCHINTSNRLAQLTAIVNFVNSSNLPCILAGDFNFSPNSDEYKYITQYFDDAAVLGRNTVNTFPSNDPKQRIDYIFLSKNSQWLVKDFEVSRTLASDHLPTHLKVKLIK